MINRTKNGINGSFNLLRINGKYLFLKSANSGLWEITGGGFEVTETDHSKIALRETFEESGIKVTREQMTLCATLGQTLRKETSEQYNGLKVGLLFVYLTILYGDTIEDSIILSDEHTEYRLFHYEEIIANWETFSSGSLWMFFTILAFEQSRRNQEGLLVERSEWQGKVYKS